MTRATCSDCGAIYDADLPEDAPGAMEPFEDADDLSPGDEVPAGRCVALVPDPWGGIEKVTCNYSCFLDRPEPTPRAPISAPGSTVEDLENDLAALDVLLRLAEYGALCCSEAREYEGVEGDGFETASKEADVNHARDVARLYSNGAGAFEPDAVFSWVKEQIGRTENSLDALERRWEKGQ